MARLLLLACILFPFLSVSQNVQWASKVVDFSSELTSVQYAADQILGKPNVLPAGGESPNAWTPSKPNRNDFITVGFDNPMRISQIMIAESYGPSALSKVYSYEANGAEHLINTFVPGEIPKTGRLINLIFDMTSYQVSTLKLEFDGKSVPEFYSVDAIGISDSPMPYEVEVNLPENLNSELSTERLSEKVNSPYKEYKPLLSPDGKTLYFSRQNHPENAGGVEDDEDIWYSELDSNGEWSEAQNATELNTPGPNFISALTPDGSSVVMLLGNSYDDKGRVRAGVSVASRNGDTWSEPENLNIINDYNYNEKAHYYLSNSRQTLFMAVERDDTKGARDMYISFLMADGSWTEPKNIGLNVNTAADESAPFLAADDKTLYFSSNGYAGFGGYDIYVTTRLDDSWLNWSDPQNMGPKINTDQEDLFFYIPVTGNFAYYSRGVNENDADIYRVSLPLTVNPAPVVVVKGKIVNSETGEPLEAKIIYERLSDGKQVGVTRSNPETGEYELVLPVGEQYGFRAEADGYIAISENVDLTDPDQGYIEMNTDLTLVPIKVEVTIVMNNVFFDFDKSTLKSESTPELDRISQFLIDNAGVKVAIKGHTDSVGEDDYNMGLSKRRAGAVANYFKSKGVNADRLDIQYFGESQPADSNSSSQGRRKNRRVEFTIVEK